MPETNKKQHKHICLYSVDIYQSVTKSWRSQINVIPLIASQITVTQKTFFIELRILKFPYVNYRIFILGLSRPNFVNIKKYYHPFIPPSSLLHELWKIKNQGFPFENFGGGEKIPPPPTWASRCVMRETYADFWWGEAQFYQFIG